MLQIDASLSWNDAMLLGQVAPDIWDSKEGAEIEDQAPIVCFAIFTW